MRIFRFIPALVIATMCLTCVNAPAFAQLATPATGLGAAVRASDSGGGENTATDRDGDGIYEYVRFPQDFDGDGTTWQTCDCGGDTLATASNGGYDADYLCGTFRASDTDFLTQTDYSAGDAAGNPAECRFHGEQVWDDTTDDLNALLTRTGPGTVIEFTEGTFALKGGGVPTADDTWGNGDQTNCWQSSTGDYSDTCQTTEDGVTMRQFGLIAHSNMKVFGQGVDPNGDKDMQFEGTRLVSNNGPRQWWNHTTVGNGYLLVGREDIMGTAGNGQILVDVAFSDNRDPGTLCVEDTTGTNGFASDWVTTYGNAGDLYVITSSQANGALTRTFAYIQEVTATACGVGGVEVVFSGATPEAQDFAEVTNYQAFLGVLDDSVAEPYVTGPVSEEYMSSGIELSDLWFSHLDYVGAGGCDYPSTETAACDNGSLLKIGSGFTHRISNVGVIQTAGAFGSGQVIDTLPWSSGAIVENSVFRFNQGGLVDVPQFGRFRGNVVEDNALINFQTSGGGTTYFSQLIRAQADNWTVEDNIFQRNSAPMDDGDTNTYTSFETGVLEAFGANGVIRKNFFSTNQLSCIVVTRGSSNMTIADNNLKCGSRNLNDTSSLSTRDRGFPLVILAGDSIPTGPLFIESNRFIGQGARFNPENNESTSAPHSSSQVLISGAALNASDNTAGSLVEPIAFLNNYVKAVDAQESVFVVMQRGDFTSGGNGDPDGASIFFDGNVVEQGNLYANYISNSYPSFSDLTAIDHSQPDISGNGTGLASCGSNLVDGVWYTNYENEFGWAIGDPVTKQCASVGGNGWAYADPCSGKPAGYQFYSVGQDYMCFCDSSGVDQQVHAPTTACAY